MLELLASAENQGNTQIIDTSPTMPIEYNEDWPVNWSSFLFDGQMEL